MPETGNNLENGPVQPETPKEKLARLLKELEESKKSAKLLPNSIALQN